MRRAWVPVLLVGVAAATALLALRGGHGPAPEASPRAGRPPADDLEARGEGAARDRPHETGAPGAPRSEGLRLRGPAPSAPSAGSRALAGVLRRSDGGPVEGAELLLLGPRASPAREQVVAVAAEGAFRVEGLGPGLHAVGARLVLGTACWHAESALASGYEEHELVLHPGAPRAAVVALGPDGEPVPAFQVRWVDERGDGASIEGRDGLAWLPVEPDESARGHLVVWGARTAGGLGLALGPARVGPLPGGLRRATVRLAPVEPITGLCLPASASTGVEVVARLVEAPKPPPSTAPAGGPPAQEAALDGSEGTVVRVRVDAAGRFLLPPVREGALHELSFLVPEGVARPAPLEVRPGGEPVAVRLGVAFVRIAVLGADGAPFVGAVGFTACAPRPGPGSSRPPPTLARTLVTDERGEVRLGPLDPGSVHDLHVQAHEGSHARVHAARGTWVRGWNPRDTVVRLERGLAVSGVVVDEHGQPHRLVVTGLQDPGERPGAADAVADGAPDGLFWAEPEPQPEAQGEATAGGSGTEAPFRLTGLGPGPVTLRVQELPGPGRIFFHPEAGVVATAVVQAGEAGLRIVVPRRPRVAVDLSSVFTTERFPKLAGVFQAAPRLELLREEQGTWGPAVREVLRPTGGPSWDEELPTSWEAVALAPDRRYALWLTLPEAGLYVYRVFTAAEPSIAPRWEAGTTVRVVLPALEPPQHVRLVLSDARGRRADAVGSTAMGSLVIGGLPPGEWEVWAARGSPDAPDPPLAEAAGRVHAGGELRLDQASAWRSRAR